MKKVVITGSTGFLGSALTKHFNDSGLYTIGLIFEKANRDTKQAFANENIYYNSVDDLRHLLEWASIDSVIHLATNYGRNDEDEINLCNFILPVKLLELCNENNVPAFLNADSFFSDLPDSYPYLKEYRKSKLNFRNHGINSTNAGNTKFLNLRIFHMYGPNDGPGKFVNDMMEMISKNVNEIDLTDGMQLRDFVYIKDVVNAFYLVFMHSDQIKENYASFDVCTNKKVSIKSFLQTAKDQFGSTTKLNFGVLPHRQGEHFIETLETDTDGLLALGWDVKFNYSDGITDFIKHKMEN